MSLSNLCYILGYCFYAAKNSMAEKMLTSLDDIGLFSFLNRLCCCVPNKQLLCLFVV